MSCVPAHALLQQFLPDPLPESQIFHSPAPLPVPALQYHPAADPLPVVQTPSASEETVPPYCRLTAAPRSARQFHLPELP